MLKNKHNSDVTYLLLVSPSCLRLPYQTWYSVMLPSPVQQAATGMVQSLCPAAASGKCSMPPPCSIVICKGNKTSGSKQTFFIIKLAAPSLLWLSQSTLNYWNYPVEYIYPVPSMWEDCTESDRTLNQQLHKPCQKPRISHQMQPAQRDRLASARHQQGKNRKGRAKVGTAASQVLVCGHLQLCRHTHFLGNISLNRVLLHQQEKLLK